mmetsp:Transcript_102609/g.289959  ORF Transcript_102609/g.289959 Transcript_102609/m.289959 type:complete len:241 (-) Transcript_102609:206-928(-)
MAHHRVPQDDLATSGMSHEVHLLQFGVFPCIAEVEKQRIHEGETGNHGARSRIRGTANSPKTERPRVVPPQLANFGFVRVRLRAVLRRHKQQVLRYASLSNDVRKVAEVRICVPRSTMEDHDRLTGAAWPVGQQIGGAIVWKPRLHEIRDASGMSVREAVQGEVEDVLRSESSGFQASGLNPLYVPAQLADLSLAPSVRQPRRAIEAWQGRSKRGHLGPAILAGVAAGGCTGRRITGREW